MNSVGPAMTLRVSPARWRREPCPLVCISPSSSLLPPHLNDRQAEVPDRHQSAQDQKKHAQVGLHGLCQTPQPAAPREML
jgi:hypothetical protein